ncbi:hypothetical protein VF21_03578 [Pseudogymnoascus sp. 05NY08]|nr:hypothetical protein VF21_03578 [Pseudogymnoascus sp. 05NY08]
MRRTNNQHWACSVLAVVIVSIMTGEVRGQMRGNNGSDFAIGKVMQLWFWEEHFPSLTISENPTWEAQIFSKDPLVIYIHNFLSAYEIEHVLQVSEGNYIPSMVYPGDDAYVDTAERVSISAYVPRDDVVRRIEQRARAFQGWRGNSTRLERLKTQKYAVNGFYNFHYDWDNLVTDGNRVTSFMIYLNANCTGGGTNFPKLKPPKDTRWCSVIDCEDNEYEGVTFKPIKGSAVFWENMYPNGTFHRGVRHASLPVKTGEKIGLNIFGWDFDWRPSQSSA